MSTTTSFTWDTFVDNWTSDRIFDKRPPNFPYEPDTCQCCAATLEFTTIPAYMKIDLGSEYAVSLVQIISRSDIESYRLPDMKSSEPRTGTFYILKSYLKCKIVYFYFDCS